MMYKDVSIQITLKINDWLCQSDHKLDSPNNSVHNRLEWGESVKQLVQICLWNRTSWKGCCALGVETKVIRLSFGRLYFLLTLPMEDFVWGRGVCMRLSVIERREGDWLRDGRASLHWGNSYCSGYLRSLQGRVEHYSWLITNEWI